MKKTILLSLFLFFSVNFFTGCKSTELRRQQRKIEQRMKESDRKAQKKYEAQLKRHMKMQSKETRKMMKQSLKRAKRLNRPKREGFFLVRWWRSIFGKDR